MLATHAEAAREYARNVGDLDPRACGCKGGGYILTNYDTWEVCRLHNIGQPHPEEYNYECEEYPKYDWATCEATLKRQYESRFTVTRADALKPGQLVLMKNGDTDQIADIRPINGDVLVQLYGAGTYRVRPDRPVRAY